jgi:hypothetical protein
MMTIATPARSFDVAGNLSGNVAVVTGSTSGIGLGIAHALALGCLGRPQRAGATRRNRAPASGTRSDLPRQNPLFARRHVEARFHRRHDRHDDRFPWASRHSRQQCRRPARGPHRTASGGEMGPHLGDQPVLGLPHDALGAYPYPQEPLGSHHQHRLGAWARRLPLQGGPCGGQARARRLEQSHRARNRGGRYHLQCHLSRLCLHPPRRRPGEGPQPAARTRGARGPARAATEQTFRDRRGNGCDYSLSRRRWRRFDHWRSPCPPMAGGRLTDPGERRLP